MEAETGEVKMGEYRAMAKEDEKYNTIPKVLYTPSIKR